MKLQFFCPRWGSESLSWDAFCSKVKQAGFDGVEAGVPFDEREMQAMQAALHQHQLLFIGQYWQSFEKDFFAHKEAYLFHLHHLAKLNPVKIDAQTGKDYFSFEQNKELFDVAAALTKETGIAVAHETHRNKALFAAHVTNHYLEQIPSLSITADFSHWCTVAESFLEDQQEAVALAIQHTIHIHARLGHTQGAQVIDPALPEWNDALQTHLQWWKQIATHHLQNNKEVLTITPEFGPAPYMMHHPLTKEPLADQWAINVWMMRYLKKELL
ncbi:MAG: sugar phosphate isomerase/epimerase [Chitinophagaceae bacterium]|nr:sugar phosphate isomerase/epimerase [Chitinophagaceae bacterium]